jgi:threonyl-tRNA synthetase
VTVDLRSSKINGKVRDAQLELIPYMLVVGREEAEHGTVTVRDRLDAEHQRSVPIAQAIAELSAEVQERRIRQKAKPSAPALAAAAEGGEANEY